MSEVVQHYRLVYFVPDTTDSVGVMIGVVLVGDQAEVLRCPTAQLKPNDAKAASLSLDTLSVHPDVANPSTVVFSAGVVAGPPQPVPCDIEDVRTWAACAFWPESRA